MSGSGLEFLGRVAGGLLHEIKNPLSTLNINLTLLKEDVQAALPGERGMLRRVEVLENEVRRLDAILNDFMRYAGMRRLDRQRCDLRDLAREMLEFVGPQFRRDGVRLEADVPQLAVDADAALFKQALLNLLLNAKEAVADAGTVTVTGGAEDGRVFLAVADDGRGIPEADLERVFDVYYSRSKAGSGLGLPTARRILEEHGGGLELTSQEGEGTRVRMWVPQP